MDRERAAVDTVLVCGKEAGEVELLLICLAVASNRAVEVGRNLHWIASRIEEAG